MNASRTDVESGALHKQSRSCKLALLVALQNLLLTGCLLAAGYVYWTGKDKDPTVDVHIHFSGIAAIRGIKNLTFTDVPQQNKMSLITDGYGSRIAIECMGPYIVYMEVCYKSLHDRESSGSLELLVVGKEEPLDSFKLNTTSEVCRGLQSVVYFRVNEQAQLRLNSTDEFMISIVTAGFNYLLGSRCEF